MVVGLLIAVDSAAISLPEAVQRAIAGNPERLVAKAQIEQAEAATDEAKAAYYPQVNVKGTAARQYNDRFATRFGAIDADGWNNANSVTGDLRQQIFDGFITRANVAQRLAEVDAAEYNQQKITETLITSTVEVYLQLREFQHITKLSKQNLVALQEIAKLVKLRADAGDTSKAETNYITARLANAEQELIKANAAMLDAKSALEFLTGELPEFEATIPALQDFSKIISQQAAERLIRQALEKNSELQVNLAEQAAARQALKGARGKYLPVLDFVIDGGHNENFGGDTGIARNAAAKFELNYSILDGGLRAATVQKQAAKIKETLAAADNIKRRLRQDVLQTYNKLTSSSNEIIIAIDEIKANQELEQVHTQQFRHGDGDLDITNLVEARERIFVSAVKKVRLVSQIVNAHYTLRQLTGKLLEDFCAGNCSQAIIPALSPGIVNTVQPNTVQPVVEQPVEQQSAKEDTHNIDTRPALQPINFTPKTWTASNLWDTSTGVPSIEQ